MSPLLRLQTDLHNYLLDAPSRIAASVRCGRGIDTATRLAIYHNAYRVRLVDTLADTFEKTRAYLGDSHFESAARAYIDTHPPTARSLRDYGGQFADFLGAGFPDDPDIAELARMDGLLRQAFDGADAAPLAANALAEIEPSAWESLGIDFVQTLSLTRLAFNTPAVWAAIDREDTPPLSERLSGAAWLLVWRRGWQPHFRTLDADEHGALAALQDGARFAQVCLDASAKEADAASRIAGYLGRWLNDEMVCGFGAREPNERRA